jgi:peptidoglycan/LPS O-acetylase OafA/YrhL/lysophospholipase L1-like esterase
VTIEEKCRLQRLRGIDGIKGLSILAILGYHLFGKWLPGGFVGIEIFFTIAGFLTARSLLIRINSSGSVSAGRYYVKRARRIVPATWFMAVFVVSLAWVVEAGDALVGVKDQLISIATFTYNWHDIAVGADYFAATGPEMFKHLWFISLLVQFYVVAPLVVWFFARYWSRTRAAIGIFVLAFGSALAMGLLYRPDGDPTRVYFGSDTHCFGLLVGVALAFMLDGTTGARGDDGSDSFASHRFRYVMAGMVGAASLAGIAYLMIFVIRQDSTAFRGGLLLVALLTALTIVGCVVPGSFLGFLLEWRPLAALGKYSFGIYLWHWPLATLILFLVPVWRSPDNPSSGLLTLVLTAVMTAISYICIEHPIAQRGFFRSLVPARDGKGGGWATWAAAILLVALAVAGTVRGVQSAPQATLTQMLLQQNQERAHRGEGGLPPAGSAPKAPHAGSRANDAIKAAPPAPVRDMPVGAQITAIGDSVMLAAQPALEKEFDGISVDAHVSRSIMAAPALLSEQLQKRSLREYVLIGLGTNSEVTTDQLSELMKQCGPGRVLVLINAHAQRSWIPPTNAVLAKFASQHSDQVVLVDWNAKASANESSLYSDGIHPTPDKGAQLYASAIHDALEAWVKKH